MGIFSKKDEPPTDDLAWDAIRYALTHASTLTPEELAEALEARTFLAARLNHFRAEALSEQTINAQCPHCLRNIEMTVGGGVDPLEK